MKWTGYQGEDQRFMLEEAMVGKDAAGRRSAREHERAREAACERAWEAAGERSR